MALPQPRQNGGEQQVTVQDRRAAVVAWLNSDNIKNQLDRALPDHVPLDWFIRLAQTAILNNADLADADKPSLLRELVSVAQLGLALDPQLGEAWLIVDRHKKVQRRVGYQGLRKLALQSGLVKGLNAQAVRANDPCEISLGDTPSVTHKIDVKAPDRGAVLGCYAIGKIEGADEPVVEWMSWHEIEQHRDRYSDAGRNKKSGPWADSLGEVEMGRKTVFRRLCKWLPKSPLLAQALAYEDDIEEARARAARVVSPDALPAPEDRQEGEAGAQEESDGNATPTEQQSEGKAAPREESDDKPSWEIDGKTYVQAARVQAILIGKVEGCRSLGELELYEGDREGGQFIQSLPPANRQAVEEAAAHQRGLLEAERRDAGEPEPQQESGGTGEPRRSQFNLLNQ